MTGQQRKLEIVVAGDSRGGERALASLDKSADTTGKKFGGLGTAAAAGFAVVGAAAVAGAGVAIDAASNLAETISKSNTIFGEAAAGIEKWASGAAKSIGQSKQQALDAAATFGNMFTQLGIGSDQAAGMSTSMVELASDFASFHNADITEVLQAQTAAFRGEFDAVQRFVPTINAAAVEQKALAMTGKAATKELTAQEKALATQALLMEGAGAATGDFARTADGLANKQRIMAAQFEDIKAKIGTALMPVMAGLVDVILNRVVPAFEAIGGWISDNKEVVAAFGAVVGTVLVAAFVTWAASAAAAAAATLAAMAPVILITAAVAALAAGVVWAYQNFDGFRNVVNTVAQFLTGTLWPALQTVAGFVTGTVVPAVATVIEWFVKWHVMVAETAVNIVGKVGEVVGFIGGAVGSIGGSIGSIIGKFGEWLGKAREIAGGIVGKLGEVVSFVSGMPGKISSAAAGMWDGIKNAFRSALNWIIRGWNSLEFKIPGFDPPGPGPKFGGFTLGVPDLPEMHGGGVVPGGPNNEPVYRLQGGEGVFTPEQMRALGMSRLGGLWREMKTMLRQLAPRLGRFQEGLAAAMQHLANKDAEGYAAAMEHARGTSSPGSFERDERLAEALISTGDIGRYQEGIEAALQHLANGDAEGYAAAMEHARGTSSPGSFDRDERMAEALIRSGGGGGHVYNISFEGAILSSERDAERWVVEALNRATVNGVR